MILTLALLTLGCGDESAPGLPPEVSRQAQSVKAKPGVRPIRIGAVLPMFSHPFFIALKRGLETKARALDIGIDVRDGQDDDRMQISQVQALVNVGCDALILCPRDEDALIPAVEAANRARVPVITLNRRVNAGRVLAYVGADDAEGGRAQAQALVEALGSKGGSIIYLEGSQGSSPQRQRAEGFHAIIDTIRDIRIIDDRFADFREDRAKTVMSGLVRRFRPEEVQAIVAQSDEMALPAAEVARAEGWNKVIVIGFDGTEAAFDAIKAGTLHATVLQDAAQQGEWAVEAAVDHLRGKRIPPEKITPLPVVTKANVHEYKPGY
jgi:ribose transport system substrate-binding protein